MSLERILRTVAAIGAVAAIVLVAAVVVALSKRESSHTLTAPSTVRVPSPAVTVGPTVRSRPAPPPAAAQCAKKGHRCNLALVDLIDKDRVRASRTPLTLDLGQTYGVLGEGANRGCVGSQGHSKAMAKTGRTWHSDRHHKRASFPRDICGDAHGAGENVARASGTEWAAIRAVEASILKEGPGGKRYKHLFSERYRRIGVGIARRGTTYYVTEDFLR